MASQQYMKNMN